jgi:ketosteroid isomerase-like protein
MYDPSHLDLAERFAQAVLGADFDAFRALTTEDCTVWYNYVGDDALTLTREQAIANIQRMRPLVAKFEYHHVRRVLTEEGYFQMVEAHCRTHSGVEFQVPVCLLATVRGGKIASYREFLDSKHLAPLAAPASGGAQ